MRTTAGRAILGGAYDQRPPTPRFEANAAPAFPTTAVVLIDN